MSNVKLISERKKIKKENNVWNDRFFLGKMEDYAKKNNVNSHYMTKFKIKGSEQYKKKLYLKHQNNTLVNIDEGLIETWNELGVNENWRYYFLQKIIVYKDIIQNAILSVEQSKMEQVKEIMKKIEKDYSNKEKSIEKLQNMNNFLQNQTNIHTNDKIYSELKSNLEIVKKAYISIIKGISQLNEITGNDIKEGKYKVEKMKCITMPFDFIENSKTFNDLIQDLNFIKNGYIGKLFSIRNNIDILITDLNKNNDYDISNEAIESFYIVINETTFKDIIKAKANTVPLTYTTGNAKRTKSNNRHNIERKQKEFVDAKEVSKHSRQPGVFNPIIGEKNVIECKSKDDEDKKDNKESVSTLSKRKSSKTDNNKRNKEKEIEIDNKTIMSNNERNLNNSIIFFYSDNISELAKDYEEYFNKIPETQRGTFHIENNITSLIKGIMPIILIKKEDNVIKSILSLSVSHEDNNAFIVNHYSTLSNDTIKSQFEEFTNYLKENKINYSSIFIHLYYCMKEGNLALSQEINVIMIQLKFKWVKLENLDNGTRFQKMQLRNQNSKQIHKKIEPIIEIKTSLLFLQSEDELTKESNKTFESSLNPFMKLIVDNLINSNTKELDSIKGLIESLKIDEGNDKEDIQRFISSNKIKDIISNLKISQYHSAYFELNPMFDSIMTMKLNNKVYHRISSKVEVLLEKETNQKFYMLLTSDSSTFIIAELNEKCKREFTKGNIYEAFSSFNSKIEPLPTENVNSIYIPSFTDEQINSTNDFENKKGISYALIKSSDKVDKVSISINPGEGDVVIENDFFIGVMNFDISNDFNISSIFCGIVNI